MKLTLYITIIALLISCSQSPIVSQLQDSDSLAIRFLKQGTDSVIKTVETSNPNAIKDLLHFADSKQTAQYKCGYDGNALGSLAGDITFNYSGDGCQHFLYMANGKLVATEMSNQAIDFFKALAAGKK
jgi:hypothetical protein